VFVQANFGDRRELTIAGVDTSRDFHLRVMEDEEFRRGAIDIQWLERRLPTLLAVSPPASLARDVAIIAALLAERDRGRTRTGRADATSGARADATDGARATAWHRAARLDSLR
jgi:acetyl-CoA carboxylase biotin carboxylase subunit